MAAGGSTSIPKLLEKFNHYDKDERYMAVLDIQNELSRDIKLDNATESRVCGAILERLEKDSSNDVQAVAVKTLSVLMKKAAPEQVRTVAERLSDHILTGRDELRDVYGIGLKTLLSDVSSSHASTVMSACVPRLLTGVCVREGKAEVACEALDCLAEAFRRFGAAGEPWYKPAAEATLTCLASAHALTRKRAIACVGALAQWLGDTLLEQVVAALLTGLQEATKGKDLAAAASSDPRTVTLIQTLGTVSKHVGYRLGRHLPSILPILISVMGDAGDETLHTDAANDLRENVLQALESFVLRSPKEVSPHIERILKLALEFARYDPNYAYDYAEDDGDVDMDMGDAEGFEDFDAGDFVDEDDTSWKVRRAAVRVVAAAVSTRLQELHSLYSLVSEPLVVRLKEREETVRLEVIAALTELVRGSGSLSQAAERADAVPTVSFAALRVPTGAEVAAEDHSAAAMPPSSRSRLTRQRSATSDLIGLTPTLIKSILKHLSTHDAKSVKTRTAVLGLLKALIHTLASCSTADFDDAPMAHLQPFVEAIVKSLVATMREGKGHAHAANLKLEAFGALRELIVAFSGRPEDIVSALIPDVVSPVSDGVRDDWYKLTAEALRCAAALVTVMRPAQAAAAGTAALAPVPTVPAPAFHAAVSQLAAVILPRLASHDIDQEIKEAALLAGAAVLGHAADAPEVSANARKMLTLFAERLRSDSTRLAALRALAYVAYSPLQPLASSMEMLNDIVPDVAAMLRQASRPLRQQALATLSVIFAAYGRHVPDAALRAVCTNVALTIDDEDLQLTAQGLRIATTMLDVIAAPTAAAVLQDSVLPKAVILACSPVLQGAALVALQAFFARSLQTLGSVAPAAFGYAALQRALLAAAAERTGAASSSGSALPRAAGAAAAAGASAATAHAESGTTSSSARHSTATLSRVLAVLCIVGADHAATMTNAKVFLSAASKPTKEIHQYLALLTVGEIGRRIDLTKVDPAAASALLGIMFDTSAAEEMKIAAASALGGLIVGNVSATLPLLLARIQETCKAADTGAEHAYLLLSALREVIIRHAPATSTGASFEPYVAAVLPLMLLPGAAGSADEGVRNIVAECVGRLAAIQPVAVVPTILELGSRATVPQARWTAVAALRFTSGAPADAGLDSVVVRLLVAGLEDADLSVRHASIQTVNALAHVAPDMLRGALHRVPNGRIPVSDKGAAMLTPEFKCSVAEEGILLGLYVTCLPRADLIREVDLGPFKHKQDDGLPLRKAAFAALDSICTSTHISDRLGPELLPIIVCGLRDVDDVRSVVSTTLAKLASMPSWHPSIVADLGAITDAVSDIVAKFETAKDANAGVDVLRAALRAVDAIRGQCADATAVKKFTDLVERVSRKEPVASVYESVRSDSTR